LGCILEAVIHSQSTTGQPDPIHLSSHFLAASRPGAYEIRISRVRTGRQFSNLIAHFFQNVSQTAILGVLWYLPPSKDQITITSHVIVGTLVPAVMTNDRSCQTIIPPHPFAIRTPFRQHPSISDPDQLPSILAFRSQLRASFDRIVEERSHAKAIAPQEGNGCFDYGACQFPSAVI
jgi:Acyl-CoA thioesterase N-terminal domain